MLSIHLTPQSDHGWALQIRCSDSEIFAASLAALKATVPPAFRRFDFAARCWVITAEGDVCLASYLELMRSRYCADVFADEAGEHDAGGGRVLPESSATMTLERAYDVLYLREGAPEQLISAAYKTLARLHHPDAGGTTAEMTEINLAYDLLLRRSAADAA